MRRRELIIGGSAAAAGLVAATQRPWLAELLTTQGPATLTARLIRPQDQLALTFRFYDISLLGPGANGPGPRDKARLVASSSNAPGFVVVDFGPQGMAEQALREGATPATTELLQGLPLDARLAASTRLGFRLPQNTGFILFSDEGLLDWTQLQPNLPANANPPNGSKARPKEPTALQTSIVYPWRLHLAPAGQSFRWNHSAAPVEHDGRTELWHTRFTSKPPLAETRNPGGLLRAVWSEDYDAKPGSVTKEYEPFRMSLNPNNRTQIVSLSSDFGLDSNPKAILARNLMLSPQGAWADLRGDFLPDGNKGFNVEQWSTRGTMGREHFAKVIERGYLLPLGHKAVLITITERKIQTIEKGRNAGRPAAVLRQRQFIVVREPQRSYDDPDFPLKRVRITTEVTPNLNQFDEPQGKLYDELTRVPEGYMDNQPAGLLGADGFWPRVGDDDFLFDLIATDVEGVEAAFKAPLMFVTLEGLKKGTPLGVYGKTTTRRARPLLGQELAYAPPLGSRPRSTAFKTETFTFGVKSKKEAPFFRPFLDRAAVEVPSLKQAAGNAPGAGMAMVRPAKLYVDAADKSQKDDPFDAVHNRAQAFLETVKDANFDTALDYGKSVAGDLVGGLGQPNLDLGGLSRTLGPLGGEIDKYADLVSDKLLFFDKYLKDAKFLGVSFADVLEFAGFPLPDLDPKAFAEQLKTMPSTLASTVYDEAQAYAQDAAGEAQKALDEASGEGQKAVDEAEKAIADAEKQLGEAKDAVGQTVKDLQEKIPKELRFDFNWEPKLKDSTFFLASGGGKTAYMKLRALTVVPLNIPTDPTKPLPDSPADLVGTPTYEVVGRLENFTLLLFGDNPFLTVEFNRVVFEASQAKKPSVDVDIRDVRFGGALEFVNELRELLSSPGNGLSIDLTANGVEVGYGLEIPNVSMGAFSLTNMSLGAGVAIPFDATGKVTASFRFCSRERPFLLTYSVFGGGGYAEIEVTPERVTALEISLEFGAAVAIDLGVASGRASIMAGFILRLEDDGPSLTGFLRLSGSLSILDLITASLEFNLSLTYIEKTKELIGTATLTVEIDVVLFSGTKEVTCEKRFSRQGEVSNRSARGLRQGATSPPQVRAWQEFVDEPAWQEYTAAFAPGAFA